MRRDCCIHLHNMQRPISRVNYWVRASEYSCSSIGLNWAVPIGLCDSFSMLAGPILADTFSCLLYLFQDIKGRLPRYFGKDAASRIKRQSLIRWRIFAPDLSSLLRMLVWGYDAWSYRCYKSHNIVVLFSP